MVWWAVILAGSGTLIVALVMGSARSGAKMRPATVILAFCALLAFWALVLGLFGAIWG